MFILAPMEGRLYISRTVRGILEQSAGRSIHSFVLIARNHPTLHTNVIGSERTRRAFQWMAVGVIYGVITAVMAAPFIAAHELGTATFAGDGRLTVWTLAWFSHAVSNGLPLFDASMFFPTPGALAYTEHMVTLGVLAWPVQILTGNPVLAFSTIWLASFWTNAVAAHLLAFRFTGRHDASLAAGVIFGWSYFRVLHLAHIQLQWTAWLPLAVLFLARWHARPTFRRLLPAFAVVLAATLTSWYLAVIAAFLCGLWLLWLICTCAERLTRGAYVQLGCAACVGVLVVLPLVSPYLRALSPGPAAEIMANSADLASYVLPPEGTLGGRLLDASFNVKGRWVWGEQTLFVGWIAMLLAGVGTAGAVARAGRRRSERREVQWLFFVLLGLIGFWLSLGPTAGDVSLFNLLSAVPGLTLFRAPARFALLVLVATAMLAAFGLALLYEWLEHAPRRALAQPLVYALAPLMLVECYAVAPNIPRASVARVPPIYGVVAQLPADSTIMSLPDYRLRPEWFLRADYLLYAAFHQRRIVNGYGRSEPPEYLSIVEQLSQFPSRPSAELAAALGVRYIVLHSKQFDSEARLELAKTSPDFKLVAERNDDFLFEVQPRRTGTTSGSVD